MTPWVISVKAILIIAKNKLYSERMHGHLIFLFLYSSENHWIQREFSSFHPKINESTSRAKVGSLINAANGLAFMTSRNFFHSSHFTSPLEFLMYKLWNSSSSRAPKIYLINCSWNIIYIYMEYNAYRKLLVFL